MLVVALVIRTSSKALANERRLRVLEAIARAQLMESLGKLAGVWLTSTTC
jgi:hypothetical protein